MKDGQVQCSGTNCKERVVVSDGKPVEHGWATYHIHRDGKRKTYFACRECTRIGWHPPELTHEDLENQEEKAGAD